MVRANPKLIVLLAAIGVGSIATADSPASEARRELEEARRLAWISDWSDAHPHFTQAEKLFEDLGDARNATLARVGRLRGEWETLSFPEVSLYLGKLLQDPLVQNDPEFRLWVLEAKGSADLEINPEFARCVWEEARDLATQLGEPARASRASGELGVVAFLEGDTATALQLVAAALANSVVHKDTGANIRYVSLMGNGLFVLGRYEEAIRYFDRALRAARSHPDLGTSVMALTGKARVLIEQAKFGEAQKLLNDALDLARRRERLGNESELLLVLADLQSRQGRHDEALALTRKAAEIASAGGFLRNEAEAWARLSELHDEAKRLPEAEEAAAKALQATLRLGDAYALPERFSALAGLRRALGQPEEANALYEQASDILDGMLVSSDSLRTRASLLAARSAVYVDHFRLALDALGDAEAAFRIIERARGRTLADVLRTPSEEMPERSEQRVLIEQGISRLQIRLMASEEAEERKTLLDQIFDAEQALGVLPSGPDRATGGTTREPIARESLQEALDPGELLLEYVLDEDSSTCLVIGKNVFRAVPLARGPEIESLVEVFLAEVRSKRPATEVSRELHKLLLEPIAEYAGKKRLVIVPDGKLHLLPFDALIAADGRRVLVSHIVSYAPSATVLKILREREPRTPDLPLLAVGDVRYQSDPEPALVAQENTTRGVFDIEGAKFVELPSTAEEIASVAEVAGNAALALSGSEATESAFKSTPLDRYQVLHLAVHGIANVQFPHRAALVLGADADSGDDGLLQVREILNLRLTAELVTLSACDTAAGRLQGQEGIASIVRTFLLAGARTAVASLWAADDIFTTALMRRFYAQLGQGADRASALRNAKLEMLERFGDQALPYHWAGFTMVGDGSQPIAWGAENREP
ncbi:MAG: CHAT domain-containing protein [Acidobacteria bacterium]|nr:CHAT domain-containing protein [Acidobacteriota bacterium]